MKNIPIVSTGKTIISRLFFLILVLAGVSGCTGTGRIVPVDDRILFDGNKTAQGTFRQTGLTVHYRYYLAGGDMTLKGRVDYTFPVDSLDLRLLFLDASGTVVRQKIVYSTGYRLSRSLRVDHAFEEKLAVPAGTAGISFSYSAQLRSGQK